MKKFLKFALVMSLCIVAACGIFSCAADTPTYNAKVTGKGRLVSIEIDDEQVFCCERNIKHPTDGVEYKLSQNSINLTDEVKAMIIAINNYDRSNHDAALGAQVAFWSVVEGYDRSVLCETYAPNALPVYKEITENAKTIDVSKYDVNVKFFEADGYQLLASFSVSEKPEETPTPEKPEEDIIPEPTPDTTPEETPEITPDPEPTTPEIEELGEEVYPEAPKTGESNEMLFYVIALAVAVVSLTSVIVFSCKKRNTANNK